MFHVPEKYRLTIGPLASTKSYGNNGAFVIPSPIHGKHSVRHLMIIASDGMGWEHVSVHVELGATLRTPHWEEMVFLKDLFWDAEDVVMQLHPKRSEYVNNHPNSLHLWRPIGVEVPTPPVKLV